MGILPPVPATTNVEVLDVVQERAEYTEFLKHQLQRAQQHMKQFADRQRSDRVFSVGEMVLLKLQPYTQNSLVSRPCPKLAYKFYGPFKVIARIGEAAYKLELPDTCQIHPVFHVSQLKTFVPDHTPVFSSLPTPIELNADDVFPEEILERRLVKRGNSALVQVRIKWANLPVEAATWEDYNVMRARFKTAPAWGHAGSQGGGIVTATSTNV